ncbi:hypothetical protein N431DRAFT_531881 [Stipitochalara longipes BDJ]|nr:hypothetical protein N431DRAFT_531881 [Stipitochalara longipes BDJ]
MSASKPSEDQRLLDRFGALLSINESSLIQLAAEVRHTISDRKPSPKDKHLSRINGGYNLIHVVEFEDGVKYVIRVPAVGWGARWTDNARNAFRSQALTLRYIKENTEIPVPEVYDFDTTQANTIGAPYMVMSFVTGCTVLSEWFKKDGPMPLEERRKTILASIAKNMSQLEKFRSEEIGSLRINEKMNKKIEIGPCYDWAEGPFGVGKMGRELEIQAFGPFKNSKAYLQYYLDHLSSSEDSSPVALGAEKITSMMIFHLPSPRPGNQNEEFALSLPDFDSQNIMVDAEGNVTGILDWDLVQTVPRFLGYCRYPEWITRDWDPIQYEYLQPQDHEQYNTTEELKKYRKWYEIEMKKCLKGGDAKFTRKSHIFEAVAIATTSNDSRLEIVKKFVERVVRSIEDLDPVKFIEEVGKGKLAKKDKHRLDAGLKALLSIQCKGM